MSFILGVGGVSNPAQSSTGRVSVCQTQCSYVSDLARPVADAGFLEGGFCYSIAKFLEATPTFWLNHAHFRSFYLSLDLLLIETSAKVSYSSSFLSL